MLKRVLMATTFAIAASSSAHAQSLLTENFDNVSTLASSGWVLTNLSSPAGSTNWYQGDSGVFSSQSGASDSYIAANYNNALAGGTIANWLISPTFSTATAGTVTFYAKADQLAPYFDSLKYGFSAGSSSNPLSFASLTTVTPVSGTWTQYTVSFAAQGAGSVGRFAIEYFGAADSANYVGIDTFSVAAVPEPATWMAMAIGLVGIGFIARRKA